MCDDLKRQFYSACPARYWPVLWLQFVIMERYLADLYAATGRAEMAYGLALGPRGQLRLVFLSDTARHYAEHGRLPTEAHPAPDVWVPICALPDHLYNDFRAIRDFAPLHAAAPPPQLYLDPG